MARSLFSFPNPVNEVSARLVAAGVLVLCVATIAFDQPWMTAVLAYGFVARVLTGPTLSPLGQLVTRVITPRLPVRAKLVPGPPKRFAQSIGLVLTTTAAVAGVALGATALAEALVAVLAAFAVLESVFGFCAGCWVFGQLMRIGLIPAATCATCADIWSRRTASAP